MGVSHSRRHFLKGDFQQQLTPLRPPWALEEMQFTDNCSGCGRCISACPTGLLIAGAGKYPQVDFSRGECTFCQQCVASCDDQAFNDPAQTVPWLLKAKLTPQCLANHGVVCSVCRDYCEYDAIRITYKTGGRVMPKVIANSCTACGACVSVCPTRALSVTHSGDHHE